MRRGGLHVGAGEDGVTIIEVLIAAVLLVVAALSALQVFASAGRANFRAEQRQVAIERAQLEMEAVRALSYEQIALTSSPASSTDPADPAWRVTTGCTTEGIATSGCYALRRNGSDQDPLIVEGDNLEDDGGQVTGAAISSTPESFTTGDVSGTIHRYVVWQNDPGCQGGECSGTQDYKRMVIAVELDSTASGGERTYQEIQSEFTDPEVGRNTEPQPSVATASVGQGLWLSDTPCSQSVRVNPQADHPAHNTLGGCSDGASTSNTPGAPDLLATSQPDQNTTYPTEFDLAGNFEPLLYDDQDTGRQILPVENLPICNTSALPRKSVHTWVTEPVPSGTGEGSGIAVEGEDTVLKLYTESTEVAAGIGGTICVELFIRDDGIGGGFSDVPLTNGFDGTTFFRFDQPAWPTSWTELTLPMDLESPTGSGTITVQPGERLGMRLAVDLAGEPEESESLMYVSFMYEHPDFDSRLELETSAPFTDSF